MDEATYQNLLKEQGLKELYRDTDSAFIAPLDSRKVVIVSNFGSFLLFMGIDHEYKTDKITELNRTFAIDKQANIEKDEMKHSLWEFATSLPRKPLEVDDHDSFIQLLNHGEKPKLKFRGRNKRQKRRQFYQNK